MSRSRVFRALIQGILACDNSQKKELGRRFAYHLGLTPSNGDGGIDGYGEINGLKIYFQCKLESKNLDSIKADLFYANLKIHRPDIAIMLAGVGYTQPTTQKPDGGFENRLNKFDDIDHIKIHLLTLRDIFENTPTFQDAIQDLPPLRSINEEALELFKT
jgi:hypothetical protein